MTAIIAVLTLALIGNAMATKEDKEAADRWVRKYLQPWAVGLWILILAWIAACELGWIT